jgi:hypothetical protein
MKYLQVYDGFLLGLFLDLEVETTCSFEASVEFQRTTWLYIPEYSKAKT